MLAAIDYGLRRVGLAVADESVRIPHPREALLVSSEIDAFKKIADWILRERVTKVYLGRPVAANGNSTDMTRAVEGLAAALHEALPGLVVEYVEERMSTQQAQKAGIAKGKQDSAVAVFLLEQKLVQ